MHNHNDMQVLAPASQRCPRKPQPMSLALIRSRSVDGLETREATIEVRQRPAKLHESQPAVVEDLGHCLMSVSALTSSGRCHDLSVGSCRL